VKDGLCTNKVLTKTVKGESRKENLRRYIGLAFQYNG
jgi:hypothetical protein